MAKKIEVTELKPIVMETRVIRIVGDSPLIMHKWSEKAKRMMLDNQTGKQKTKGHEIKNPVGDFIESMYWMTEEPTDKSEEGFEKAVSEGARWGFPATAIKKATCSAGYRNGFMPDKVTAYGTFFIKGYGPDQCVEIKGCVPHIREDMVRVGIAQPDIRFRGQFDEWYADIEVSYNKNGTISFEQIVNMINLSGFSCGIGEWRPEKGGNFGMYHVHTEG